MIQDRYGTPLNPGDHILVGYAPGRTQTYGMKEGLVLDVKSKTLVWQELPHDLFATQRRCKTQEVNGVRIAYAVVRR